MGRVFRDATLASASGAPEADAKVPSRITQPQLHARMGRVIREAILASASGAPEANAKVPYRITLP